MSFIELIEGCSFESYQENGTKYLKNTCQLPANIVDELNQCTGELYLCRIPEHVTAEEIVKLCSLLGEVYILRFKVNFAGQSRGIAYMQYVNPSLMDVAIQHLPEMFRVNGLYMIRVRKSENCSNLVLRNVQKMTGMMVEQMIRKYVDCREINARQVRTNKFEYQIVFRSNDEAVKGRRAILQNIYSFGSSAIITWDRPINY